MNKKKPVIWTIRINAAGKYYMVDEKAEMRWSPDEKQSRHEMADFAFDNGADEVLHDYKLT